MNIDSFDTVIQCVCDAVHRLEREEICPGLRLDEFIGNHFSHCLSIISNIIIIIIIIIIIHCHGRPVCR